MPIASIVCVHPSLLSSQRSLCGHYLPALLCPPLYLYQYGRHLSISHLQGNGNYLRTCVLNTIKADPIIIATLPVPCCVIDGFGAQQKQQQTWHGEGRSVPVWFGSIRFGSISSGRDFIDLSDFLYGGAIANLLCAAISIQMWQFPSLHVRPFTRIGTHLCK